MCLTDTKKFRFTIFPKIVYKIVYVEDGNYFSAFQSKNITLIHMQCPLSKKAEPISKFGINNELRYYEFGDGFVFGFTDLLYALYKKHYLRQKEISSTCPKKYIIIKGIIPPFTRYACEAWDNSSEICARRIFWYKECKKYDYGN